MNPPSSQYPLQQQQQQQTHQYHTATSTMMITNDTKTTNAIDDNAIFMNDTQSNNNNNDNTNTDSLTSTKGQIDDHDHDDDHNTTADTILDLQMTIMTMQTEYEIMKQQIQYTNQQQVSILQNEIRQLHNEMNTMVASQKRQNQQYQQPSSSSSSKGISKSNSSLIRTNFDSIMNVPIHNNTITTVSATTSTTVTTSNDTQPPLPPHYDDDHHIDVDDDEKNDNHHRIRETTAKNNSNSNDNTINDQLVPSIIQQQQQRQQIQLGSGYQLLHHLVMLHPKIILRHEPSIDSIIQQNKWNDNDNDPMNMTIQNEIYVSILQFMTMITSTSVSTTISNEPSKTMTTEWDIIIWFIQQIITVEECIKKPNQNQNHYYYYNQCAHKLLIVLQYVYDAFLLSPTSCQYMVQYLNHHDTNTNHKHHPTNELTEQRTTHSIVMNTMKSNRRRRSCIQSITAIPSKKNHMLSNIHTTTTQTRKDILTPNTLSKIQAQNETHPPTTGNNVLRLHSSSSMDDIIIQPFISSIQHWCTIIQFYLRTMKSSSSNIDYHHTINHNTKKQQMDDKESIIEHHILSSRNVILWSMKISILSMKIISHLVTVHMYRIHRHISIHHTTSNNNNINSMDNDIHHSHTNIDSGYPCCINIDTNIDTVFLVFLYISSDLISSMHKRHTSYPHHHQTVTRDRSNTKHTNFHNKNNINNSNDSNNNTTTTDHVYILPSSSSTVPMRLMHIEFVKELKQHTNITNSSDNQNNINQNIDIIHDIELFIHHLNTIDDNNDHTTVQEYSLKWMAEAILYIKNLVWNHPYDNTNRFKPDDVSSSPSSIQHVPLDIYWMKTKRTGSFMAMVLDILEFCIFPNIQLYHHPFTLSCIILLQDMILPPSYISDPNQPKSLSYTTAEYYWSLVRTQFVTTNSTADTWHISPTIIEIFIMIFHQIVLYQMQHDHPPYTSHDTNSLLLSLIPTRNHIIRFMHRVLLYIHHDQYNWEQEVRIMKQQQHQSTEQDDASKINTTGPTNRTRSNTSATGNHLNGTTTTGSNNNNHKKKQPHRSRPISFTMVLSNYVELYKGSISSLLLCPVQPAILQPKSDSNHSTTTHSPAVSSNDTCYSSFCVVSSDIRSMLQMQMDELIDDDPVNH